MNHELRWWQAWIFLSLDMIQPYQEDLWLSFLDLSLIQDLLKKVLRFTINNEQNNKYDYLMLNYRICNLVRNWNEKQFNKIAWWIKEIYIDDGNDRVIEDEWSSIIIDIFYKRIDLPRNHITRNLRILSQKFIEKASLVRSICSGCNNSIWDKEILQATQCTIIDDIYTTIYLMLHANTFIWLWNKYIGDLDFNELVNIYKYGNKKNVNISFPGSWMNSLTKYQEYKLIAGNSCE